MFASVITLFQLRSFWKVGFLPAVCNQGLFALCINVFSCRLSTVWFSGMTCARGLVSRPATCAGSPPVSPSFFGLQSQDKKKWGGEKGTEGRGSWLPFSWFSRLYKTGFTEIFAFFLCDFFQLAGVCCVCMLSNIG